jgi:hypothetical protein
MYGTQRVLVQYWDSVGTDEQSGAKPVFGLGRFKKGLAVECVDKAA